MSSLFQKFITLSSLEKKLFIEAYFFSVYSRFVIKIFPFKWYEKSLGQKNKILPATNYSNREMLSYIKFAVRRVSRHSFWRNQCFEQSYATMLMLKRRNIPYTLYFGLQHEDKTLKAHVWIATGDFYFVNKGNINFTTVSTYSN